MVQHDSGFANIADRADNVSRIRPSTNSIRIGIRCESILTSDPASMGRWVAEHAAADLRKAIADHGNANIVVATGASQFEVLGHLVSQPGIDWSLVEGFHLDEYVGLAGDHGASFCGYLKQRFVDQVELADFHYLRGDQDPQSDDCQRRKPDREHSNRRWRWSASAKTGTLPSTTPPPTSRPKQPYIIVELDEPCRMQQVGEGWFESLADVPTHAISMSVRQILKAARIYCSVPDERKAAAVRDTLEGPITPEVPASICGNTRPRFWSSMKAAASKLSPETLRELERAECRATLICR